MRNTRKIQEVQFDSIDELMDFLRDSGHADFYNEWERKYHPIKIDWYMLKPVYEFDDNDWLPVEENHLANIYGFIPESSLSENL